MNDLFVDSLMQTLSCRHCILCYIDDVLLCLCASYFVFLHFVSVFGVPVFSLSVITLCTFNVMSSLLLVRLQIRFFHRLLI